MIRIVTKNVYGNELLYVTSAECKWISQLTGKKTVTAGDVDALRRLGHEIEFCDSEGNWETLERLPSGSEVKV